MEISLPSGKYVVAVSGGVDSVALLHLLSEQHRRDPSLKLIVAHFDHGIRSDSALDRQHVQSLAGKYGLPFIFERTNELGSHANEAAARQARYEFLRRVQQASGADALVTAHHQDDLIETAFINLVRGTAGRGLHSLQSHADLYRPLLHISKRQLKNYATENGLVWREDSTNIDESILRNYIRARYVSDLGKTRRSQIIKVNQKAAELSCQIAEITAQYLHLQPNKFSLNRPSFIQLPHEVAREIIAAWLRERVPEVELSRRMLERLVVAAKTGRSGSLVDIAQGHRFKLLDDAVELQLKR